MEIKKNKWKGFEKLWQGNENAFHVWCKEKTSQVIYGPAAEVNKCFEADKKSVTHTLRNQ